MVPVIISLFLLWQRPLVFLFLESLGSNILHRVFEVLCCLQQASAHSLGLQASTLLELTVSKC